MPTSENDAPKWAEWLAFQTLNDPALVKLVCACADWVKAVRAGMQPRWLTICGVSGTGKTHCAKRLFNYTRGKTHEGNLSYIPHPIYWPDFVQQLKAGEAFRKRDDMKQWPVLLLDDIGAEKDNKGFSCDELNTLLGTRGNRWTIITTNLTMQQLDAMDRRIASRLIRGANVVVSVSTTDYSLR